VFEIAKTAHGYASTPTTLVSFNITDGAEPSSSLIADARGDLFGTTSLGGLNIPPSEPEDVHFYGNGTVFEIAKTAHGYASTPTKIFFNGTDGSNPSGSLIADARGDLFGTTVSGGANWLSESGSYFGTVFEITDSGFSPHKTPSCTVVEAHDQFVFDPNLGENPTVNSNVHDETIDHFKSEFAQFAELQTQTHQDAVNPTFDAVDPMHHTATLAAQHAHHFLV
jgi:hypothetical protein